MSTTNWLSKKCRWSEARWLNATSCSTSQAESPSAKGTSRSKHLFDLLSKAVIARLLRWSRESSRFRLKISSYLKSSRSFQQSTMRCSRPPCSYNTWKSCVLIMATCESSGTSPKDSGSILGQKQTMNGYSNKSTQCQPTARRPNPNSMLRNSSSLRSSSHQLGSRPYLMLKKRSSRIMAVSR